MNCNKKKINDKVLFKKIESLIFLNNGDVLREDLENFTCSIALNSNTEQLLDVLGEFHSKYKESKLQTDIYESMSVILLDWLEFLGLERISDEEIKRIEELLINPTPHVKEVRTMLNKVDDMSIMISQQFLNKNTKKIAYILTSIDFNLFKNIRPMEFLGYINDDIDKSNLTKIANRFNDTSFFFSQLILNSGIDTQLQIIEGLIKIAVYLLEMDNYNTLSMIVSSLTTVRKLKSTWEKIPAGFKKKLIKIKNLMSPINNYKKYRDHIKNKNHIYPLIPVILRDVIYINESTTSDSLNDEKLDLLSDELYKIKSFQDDIYLEIINQNFDNKCKLDAAYVYYFTKLPTDFCSSSSKPEPSFSSSIFSKGRSRSVSYSGMKKSQYASFNVPELSYTFSEFEGDITTIESFLGSDTEDEQVINDIDEQQDLQLLKVKRIGKKKHISNNNNVRNNNNNKNKKKTKSKVRLMKNSKCKSAPQASNWNMKQTTMWAKKQKINDLDKTFLYHRVDGSKLLQLNNSEAIKKIGIKKKSDQKHLITLVNDLEDII